MSIDFNYTPIPKFFQKNGYLDPKKDGSHFKMFFLLHYLFSRCQSVPHSRYHNQRLINFSPWEFLCGREEASIKTGLTENEVRNQLIRWENQGLLKKSTNSVTNKYTCYIWSSELFFEKGNQQSNQQVTNRQPTGNHKEETKNDKEEEEVRESIASQRIDIRSILSQERMEEEIKKFMEYTASHMLPVPRHDATIWLKKHPLPYVYEIFDLLVCEVEMCKVNPSKKRIPKHLAWIQKALDKNYPKINANSKHLMEIAMFYQQNGWPNLRVTTRYAVDDTIGKDFYFDLPDCEVLLKIEYERITA